jgi:hypothetical protein
MQPFSRQRIGKRVPVATNVHETMGLLLETVFSTHSAQKGYKEDNWGDPVSWGLSSKREAEKRWRYISVHSSVVGYSPDSNGGSTEAEESPIVESCYQETTSEDQR